MAALRSLTDDDFESYNDRLEAHGRDLEAAGESVTEAFYPDWDGTLDERGPSALGTDGSLSVVAAPMGEQPPRSLSVGLLLLRAVDRVVSVMESEDERSAA